MAISLIYKAIAAIRRFRAVPDEVLMAMEPEDETQLVPSPFLQDEWIGFMLFGAKPHGDGFVDVLTFDRITFDTKHDFIQWLLPNRVSSPINPTAPVLSDLHVEAFRRLPELRTAVDQAVAKFYAFMGIREIKGGFERQEDFEKGSQYWLCRLDHNHRRISRLLTFFCEIGKKERAVALMAYMESALAEQNLSEIEALPFWRDILAKG